MKDGLTSFDELSRINETYGSQSACLGKVWRVPGCDIRGLRDGSRGQTPASAALLTLGDTSRVYALTDPQSSYSQGEVVFTALCSQSLALQLLC